MSKLSDRRDIALIQDGFMRAPIFRLNIRYPKKLDEIIPYAKGGLEIFEISIVLERIRMEHIDLCVA